MALILKEGETLPDPTDGVITTAYAVIKRITSIDFISKSLTFYLDIYRSAESRQSLRKVLYSNEYFLTIEEFNSLNWADICASLYEVLDSRGITNWQSDE